MAYKTYYTRRNGCESVIFTAVEKKTYKYVAIRILGRTCVGVDESMTYLQELYGNDRISQVF